MTTPITDAWLVPAAEIAEASGLPEAEWLAAIGRHLPPQFRQGEDYTDIALLVTETTFELACRLGGDAVRLGTHVFHALTPSLFDVWHEAKLTGRVRPIEVVVRDGAGEDLVRFHLGAVARALARFEGGEDAVTESLEALRDVVYQQRADGTFDRLAAFAATLHDVTHQ